MRRSRLLSLLLVAAVCVVLLVVARPGSEAHVLAAGTTARWYRGNMHTHTLWSDGDDYPEMVAAWYRDHDYQFLAITDHNVLATSERWTDVLKNSGGQTAYDKLKARFPEKWVQERTTEVIDSKTKKKEQRLEVRLKQLPEIQAKLQVPNQFLLLQGEEISDKFQRYPIHLNAINVKEVIPPLGGESVTEVITRNVDALNAQRQRTNQPMLIQLNHPNWGFGVTAEDLVSVRGEKFFEVYNGHPGVNNAGNAVHSSTDRIWDIILTKRLGELQLPVMYGMATDDGHNYHQIPSRKANPGRGWVMVLAKALTADSLIRAMEAGEFYASSGVTLKSVSSSAAGLAVEVEPETGVTYTIEFIGTRTGYDPTGKPALDAKGQPVLDTQGKPVRATLSYSADIGKVLATSTGMSARYDFSGNEIYVRARVTASKLHPNPSVPGEFVRAWVQPVVGPAAKKEMFKPASAPSPWCPRASFTPTTTALALPVTRCTLAARPWTSRSRVT